jgi:hypothetical protein
MTINKELCQRHIVDWCHRRPFSVIHGLLAIFAFVSSPCQATVELQLSFSFAISLLPQPAKMFQQRAITSHVTNPNMPLAC